MSNEAVRYYNLTETAKLVRADLKANFPGTKFSVRSERASMMSAIRVEWTDGPTTGQVDRVVDGYCGQGFDGMTDSTTYHDTFDPKTGERVDYGVSHMSTRRTHSDAFRARVAAKLALEGVTVTPYGNEVYRAAYIMNADTGCTIKFR